MRLVQTQVWPALRNLQAIAPFDRRVEVGVVEDDEGRVAAQLHADTFFTVSAHCLSRILPTSVEPVNESLRTVLLAHSSPPITEALPVTTLKTPFGHARPLGQLGQRQRAIGRGARGLDHHRAAGGERRARPCA